MTSTSPTIQKIATTFRLTGWVSVWAQGILTLVSGFTLLFAGGASTRTPGTTAASPGTGIGGFLTLLGIGVLVFNIYWAFSRYVLIGRKLRGDAADRPKKSDTIQAIRVGLIASLAGMLLALIGAEAIVGALAAKAFTQGFGSFVNVDPSKFIQPLDVLVVQASINVILAQFLGIAAALWLLNRMSR